MIMNVITFIQQLDKNKLISSTLETKENQPRNTEQISDFEQNG